MTKFTKITKFFIMAQILLQPSEIEAGVLQFIYEKQSQFRIQKGRVVSLGSTVNRLLKEAYKAEIETILHQKKSPVK